MKNLFVTFGLLILTTACSNPFSSQKSSVLEENPKPTNTNCSEVRFDESELSAKQFRAVVHCLNQKQELKEIEAWSLTVSDQELQPWVTPFNSVLKNEPTFLYALKEIYLEERDNGDFQNFATKLFSKLQKEEDRKALVSLLKKHSPWLRNFISTPRYELNFPNLTLLSEVKSFDRGYLEQYQTGKLKNILTAIEHYRSQSNSFSFKELFSFFAQTNPQTIANPKSAEQISGFINWLLDQRKIETFSLAAESLSTKSITCFNDEKSITEPLKVLLTELQTIKPSEFPEFLQSRVNSVLLVGQNYCRIPDVVISAAKVLLKSTEQETLVPFFGFIQPLLKDPRFVSLLASSSFRNLAHELSDENNTHIFQDLITLVNWSQKNPISTKNTADLMDSMFNEFKSDEIWFVMNLLPEDSRFFVTFQKVLQALPKLEKTKALTINEDWLAPLSKDSLVPVLDLLSRMNEDHKIIPIIDRIVDLFKNMLNRGKSKYQPANTMKPTHASGTISHAWELSFWKNKNSFSGGNTSCSNLPLDLNFFRTSKELPPNLYLEQLDNLAFCFGANQSFSSLKELAHYLLEADASGKLFNQFNSIQTGLLNYLFSLDTEQSLQDVERILHLSTNDLAELHRAIQGASLVLSASKNSLRDSTELRKLLGKYISKKETFAAIASQVDAAKPPKPSVNDLNSQLEQIVLKALPNLFQKYCPNLDVKSADCDVDTDQVQIYRNSPSQLARMITREYLSTPQSWMHPLEFRKWDTSTNPQNVSSLNFHLDPLLGQFAQKPKAVHGVFEFLKRNQTSSLSIFNYLQKRSHSIQVIPYLFQSARYPNADKEFHQLIRFRIVNDVDRLELLAINADFKPFGVMKNFGMNFIKEIATSWGDVPESKRPALGTSETLAEARTSILNEYNKFNLGIIQKMGSCDPRGKNRLGHWIQNQFCKGDLGDIRARMFNLGFMLTIIDHPEELALLRDLFYSIYENNTDTQMGVYTDSVKNFEGSENSDLLEVIPKVARLGILHQAGVSLMHSDSTVPNSVLSILNQTVHENKSDQLSNTISSASGQLFVRDLLSLGMSLNDFESENIAVLLEQVSLIKNQEWLSFVLKLSDREPRLLSTFSPTLHDILMRFNASPLTSEMLGLLSNVSADLNNEALVNETSKIVKDLTSHQKQLSSLIHLKMEDDLLTDWLRILSKDQNQKQRDQIASFVTGKSFDEFCDVFSDSTFAEKTYIFLEKSNQNSGVSALLDECRRFLH